MRYRDVRRQLAGEGVAVLPRCLPALVVARVLWNEWRPVVLRLAALNVIVGAGVGLVPLVLPVTYAHWLEIWISFVVVAAFFDILLLLDVAVDLARRRPRWKTVLAPNHQLPREAVEAHRRVRKATGRDLMLRRLMLEYHGRGQARILSASLYGYKFHLMAKIGNRAIWPKPPPERAQRQPGRHRFPVYQDRPRPPAGPH